MIFSVVRLPDSDGHTVSPFDHDRPFEREFEGIQKFEPISRMHESQVDILHVGRNEKDGYFYYVMELADDANVARASSLQVARVSVPAVPEDPAFQRARPAARTPPEPAGETPALRPETYVPKKPTAVTSAIAAATNPTLVAMASRCSTVRNRLTDLPLCNSARSACISSAD